MLGEALLPAWHSHHCPQAPCPRGGGSRTATLQGFCGCLDALGCAEYPRPRSCSPGSCTQVSLREKACQAHPQDGLQSLGVRVGAVLSGTSLPDCLPGLSDLSPGTPGHTLSTEPWILGGPDL